MSKGNTRLLLADIPEAIEKVERHLEEFSFRDFQSNDMIVGAVTRNLEIIGKAVERIPQEIKAKYPTIEWRRAAGFRDIAIHAYFAVDVEVLWVICYKATG